MATERRVAVVTGAAQGIGRRTAVELAAHGYDVALLDVRPAEAAAGQIRDAGAVARAYSCDVSDEAQVDAAIAAVLADLGRIDVLVNNAGISHIARAEETSPADWRRVLDINLTGPFLLCRAVGPHMLERGEGSIVNIASVAGLLGIADRSAYNASKHGLIGLTRTIAAEWGGRGVRCNAVCPGWVRTEMDAVDQAAGTYTDEDITGRIPMGRFAAPGDIARAVAFLADPALSGFVNGAALPVDGGWSGDGSWESLRMQHR